APGAGGGSRTGTAADADSFIKTPGESASPPRRRVSPAWRPALAGRIRIGSGSAKGPAGQFQARN
ncbi:MAG: hypothetical protein VX310_04285, partial [Gemmatimonadota bacterium]|nr:hypothetical protein [Gemmatimonadota bacterium]